MPKKWGIWKFGIGGKGMIKIPMPAEEMKKFLPPRKKQKEQKMAKNVSKIIKETRVSVFKTK